MSKVVLTESLANELLTLATAYHDGLWSAKDFPIAQAFHALNADKLDEKEQAAHTKAKLAHDYAVAAWRMSGDRAPRPEIEPYGEITLTASEFVLPEGWEVIPDDLPAPPGTGEVAALDPHPAFVASLDERGEGVAVPQSAPEIVNPPADLIRQMEEAAGDVPVNLTEPLIGEASALPRIKPAPDDE